MESRFILPFGARLLMPCQCSTPCSSRKLERTVLRRSPTCRADRYRVSSRYCSFVPKFSRRGRSFAASSACIDPKTVLSSTTLDPVPISSQRVPDFYRLFPNHRIASVVSGFAVGLLAGFTGSLVGLGGTFILIPMFVSVLLFTQLQASGTSLCAVAVTGMIGAYNYWRQDRISLIYGVLITVAASLTARFGALTASSLDAKALKKSLGMWWMVAACRMAYTAVTASNVAARAITKAISPLASASLSDVIPLAIQNWGITAAMLLTGSCTGFLSGLLGIAGGAIVVPVLTEIGVMQQAAQGTSLFACIAPAIVGSFTHIQKNNIRLEVLPGVLPGAVLGATLGPRVACILPERTMKIIFAVLLLYSGAKMAGFIGGLKDASKAVLPATE